jgi:hypothetical protein
VIVEAVDELIEILQELLTSVEVTLQVDLREKKTQPLKVFPLKVSLSLHDLAGDGSNPFLIPQELVIREIGCLPL